MSWKDSMRNLQRTSIRVFGEDDNDGPILYHPGGSGSFEIEGIYREAGQGADVGLAALIRTDDPELHVRLEDVLAKTGASRLASDDEVTVRGIRRGVAEHMPDGEGLEVLKLKEGLS